MRERWFQMKGNPELEVSNFGFIRRKEDKLEIEWPQGTNPGEIVYDSIIGLPEDFTVIHLNGDETDNRISNLTAYYKNTVEILKGERK